MTPGETGELFAELSGEKKSYPKCSECGGTIVTNNHVCFTPVKGENRKVHYNPDGSIHFIQNAGLDPDPESKTTVSSDGPGYNFSTYDEIAGSGMICACGTWVPYGEEHYCYLHPKPVTVDISTNGYQCVFCGVWVDTGWMHNCLSSGQIKHWPMGRTEILEKLDQVLEKLKFVQSEAEAEIAIAWIKKFRIFFHRNITAYDERLLDKLEDWIETMGKEGGE